MQKGHVEKSKEKNHKRHYRERNAEHTLMMREQRGLLIRMTCQKNREHEQHHDAARIYRNLHRSEKLIAELEIKHGCGKEHKQQICGRTQYFP